MYYQILSYINFIKDSKNQHGIHSPFVYNLITKCLNNNDKIEQKIFRNFLLYKKDLLLNKNNIKVTDLGAGSRVFKDQYRKVSDIAKTAGISNKEARILIKIVSYFKPKTMLELGTSLGMGTYCLHLGNTNVKIKTLEGCPETAQIAINQFKKFNTKNIEVTIGDFKHQLPKTIANTTFDMIYFDGNHQEKATIDYFNLCLQTVHNESIFIFDDIHWSKGMENAWNIIRDHKMVSVSIDLFFWGILFFRKEQPKQHFKIRV